MSEVLTYEDVIAQVRANVSATVPPGASVLVVSKGDRELLVLGVSLGRHFPQTARGEYAGHHPADAASAIEQLEDLRSRGSEFLVFPQTAFWWFEHYGALHVHLRARYREVLNTSACVVFDLRAVRSSRPDVDAHHGSPTTLHVQELVDTCVARDAEVALVGFAPGAAVTLTGRRTRLLTMETITSCRIEELEGYAACVVVEPGLSLLCAAPGAEAGLRQRYPLVVDRPGICRLYLRNSHATVPVVSQGQAGSSQLTSARPRPKVLFVVHNHASIRPGGVETYAAELHQAFLEAGVFEPLLLARVGAPLSNLTPHPVEGPIWRSDEAGQPYFFFTEHTRFDTLFGTLRDKDAYIRHFRTFLETHTPDVVHLQHTLFLGYDLIREVRNTLPCAAIVCTLQEFLPICHRSGQMLRVTTNEPCLEASPSRCHECFPDVSPALFFQRARFIRSQLDLVDGFIAPSHFLRDRYVDWGIAPERIRCEDYGRLPGPGHVRPAGTPDTRRDATRFGFFGQFTPYKGVDVLLEAFRLLSVRGSRATLRLHGANLELQSSGFRRRIEQLLAASPHVQLVGQYAAHELPLLMDEVDWVVVPSIWWENSPLVIQEAFQFGRPVICSDIGGMAEKVTHGVNGLHFTAADPVSLADTIERAATTPGLHDQLRGGIPPVHDMRAHVALLTRLYASLLESKRPSAGGQS